MLPPPPPAACRCCLLPRPPAAQRNDASPTLLQIVDLAACAALTRLDVSKNSLASLDGLGANTKLRWLSAANNSLTVAGVGDVLRDLEALEVSRQGGRAWWTSPYQDMLLPHVSWPHVALTLGNVGKCTGCGWTARACDPWHPAALPHLPAAQVLNLGGNQLAGKLAVGRLRELRALILNDNQLTLVGGARTPAGLHVAGRRGVRAGQRGDQAVTWMCRLCHPCHSGRHISLLGAVRCAGLDKCRELNTLVLSHNSVAALGSWLGGAPKLAKLSLSHNQLAELGGALR